MPAPGRLIVLLVATQLSGCAGVPKNDASRIVGPSGLESITIMVKGME